MASAAARLLASTYRKMQMEPVEGIMVELVDDSDLFEWRIWMEGPPDTLYQGGVFELIMKFPPEYPMLPPELQFISEFWHPNVYKETGVVCISILHPPGEDSMSGEEAGERWMPTQTVQTILLSVLSLLSAPNFFSPANVDANVEHRDNNAEYKRRIAKLVKKANEKKPPHVVIPHPDTDEEQRKKQIAKINAVNSAVDTLEEEMMYDSREPSDDEQDPDESVPSNEDQSQSEKSHSDSTKEKSKSKHSNKSKPKAPSNNTTQGTKKDQKHNDSAGLHKKKDEMVDPEPNLTETRTRRKKKCAIM